MTAEIDVVIPTWNGRALLRSCLEHLEAQTVPFRTIVVDNGSTDGTLEWIEREHPDVTLVGFPDNRGFAPAVNLGIKSGEAAYIVLLNNDVDCDPAFIERIVEPLRGDERVGMVASLLLKPGRREIDSYGLEFDATLSAFPRFAGAVHPGTPLDEDHLAGPSGGAAAYRREALEAVGGFDVNLFAYMEDVDLAVSIAAAGWACAGAPAAVGVHLGSATVGLRSPAQVEIYGASRIYVLRKYGLLRKRPLIAAWAVSVEIAVCVAELFGGRGRQALRGRLRGWRRGRGAHRSTVPPATINRDIGPIEAMRRRHSAARPSRSI